MSKIEAFVQTNLRWIIALVFAVTLVYFDARYSSSARVAELEEVVKGLKHDLAVKAEEGKYKNVTQDNAIEAIRSRQEKKIKIQNDILGEIDENENKLIKIETQMEFLHKDN